MQKAKTAKWLSTVTVTVAAVCAALAMWGGLDQTEMILHDAVFLTGGFFEKMMRGLSFLGDTSRVIIICAILLLIPKFNMKCGLPAVLCTAVSGGLNNGIKYLFGRARPALDWLIDAHGFSFPSGHAMNNMALYSSLAFCLLITAGPGRVKRVIAALLFVLPLFIGFSRIYFGVHFTSDVIAGWSLGLLCAYWTSRIYREKLYERFTHKGEIKSAAN